MKPAFTNNFYNAFSLEMHENNEVGFSEAFDLVYPKVLYFLKNNHHKLFNILYRLDVNEEAVKKSFGYNSNEQIASSITHLIIEREKQKMETRKRYRFY